jgi:hypothetical protein
MQTFKFIVGAMVISSSVSSLRAGVAVSVGQNFTGIASSLNRSPNAGGDVNADYYAEFDVDTFAVYSKADGSVLQSVSFQQFWRSAGVTLPNNPGWWNIRIIYDPTVQRWFVATDAGELSDVLTGRLWLAISSSADPTGTWNGVTFADHPGGTNHLSNVNLGVDAKNVYISSEIWSTNDNEAKQLSSGLLALPKADLLASPPVTTNGTWLANLSSTSYGYSIWPAICFDGTTAGICLATASAGVDTYGNPETNNDLIVTGIQAPGGSSLVTPGTPQVIRVLPYTEPINYALQPDGSSTNLVDWDATISANVYCVGGVLFAVHALQYGPHIALRWYRIRASDNTLLESGTINNPDLDLYFPSIAANSNGTVFIACNGSGLNQYVSCYALVGQTVNWVTTFGDLLLLQAGAASYQNLDSSGNNNWGSYSTTSVDPTDPNVFWTINTYAVGSTTWATQITQLLTSPSPQLSIASAGGNLLLSWPMTTVPFQLLSAPNLADPNAWAAVTPTPSTNGATVSVLVPAASTSAFFRLVQSQ